MRGCPVWGAAASDIWSGQPENRRVQRYSGLGWWTGSLVEQGVECVEDAQEADFQEY